MIRSSTRRSSAALLAVAALGVFVLAGCGSSNSSESATGAADAGPCGTTDDTTLTVGLFGTFGFKENGLYDAYKKVCPNITVKEDVVEQSADYWTRLKTRLASSSGLDDVQAVEIGFVADVVKNHASQFVNFNDVAGADKIKSAFYDWKWNQASSPDGKTTVGLGTDTGPEAICYRRDLLSQAGMESDPKALASKWSTWDDFIAFGNDYKEKTGKPFVDSPASIFSTAVYQGKTAYAKADGTADVENSDGEQTAWNYATKAATDGITAGLSQFSDPWNKAFSSGTFAALACPTWMMGYIQGQAGPSVAGKWDIAPVLPGGPTNWGGSWLGVPQQAQNKAAGVALVKWLSDKQQQVTMWTSANQGGPSPPTRGAAEAPKVAQATSSNSSNPRGGQILGAIAGDIKLPPIGLYDTQIQNALTTQLGNVATKGTDPDKAFSDAMDEIEQVTG